MYNHEICKVGAADDFYFYFYVVKGDLCSLDCTNAYTQKPIKLLTLDSVP